MTRWLVLVCLLCGWVVQSAAEPLVLSPFTQNASLAPHISYWPEAREQTTLREVLNLSGSAWTTNPRQEDLSLGYQDRAYWFRVTVYNPQLAATNHLLEISYPVLDHVDIFSVMGGTDDGLTVEQVGQSWTLGDKQPFYARPVQHRNFLVPLTFPPESEVALYLRVKTSSSLQLPMTLWEPQAFFAAEQPRLLLEGVYYGIVLVMILYNLFVFMAVGERSFLYYVGFITAMPLFIASLHGVSFQYLWPEATWWNDQSIIFFLNLVVAFGGIFAMRFLSVLPHTHPRLARITLVVVVASLVFALAALVIPYKFMILPSIVLAAIGCIGMLLLSAVRLFKKDPAARYYGVAWFFMLFGGIVLALNKFTLLPQNLFTENATQVGSALGVILLSIALADRLNKEKRRAFEAQESLYREERKARLAQEKSLQIQQEANVLLEERVQERTRDLEALNERLRELSATDALTGLKNRGYFDRAFQSACVKAYRFGQPLSLIVVDIDHFKQFNDTFGHLVGDDCLQMVAQGIRQFVTRPQDLAARYGGEEFVVVLPDTPEEGALRVAEKIREGIESTDFRVSDEVIRLTVSIGVCSVIPARADAAKQIFRQADEALYEAKGAGRNRVSVYGRQGGFKLSTV